MRIALLLPLLFLVPISCRHAPESRAEAHSRLETHWLRSRTFDNERMLRIYLPPGYDAAEEELNVLYLNDGQNAMVGDSLGRRQDWRVDEIADSLIRSGDIPPMVVVGIDNIGMADRGREYLPWEDVYLSPPIPRPEGAKYPEFIVEEVLPFVEARYRVKRRGAGVGIGGFSYGGLAAVYVAMRHPERFGVLLAETPSLYVDEQRILDMAETPGRAWSDRVYVGVGTNEAGLDGCPEDDETNLLAVTDSRRLISLVQTSSPSTLTKLTLTECGTHSFEQVSSRLPAALVFLYGPTPAAAAPAPGHRPPARIHRSVRGAGPSVPADEGP